MGETTKIILFIGLDLLVIAVVFFTITAFKRWQGRKYQKRWARMNREMDREIFRDQEFFEEDIKNRSGVISLKEQIPHSDEDYLAPSSQHEDYHDGNDLLRQQARHAASQREDLAVQSVTPFEHGGLKAPNSTNYLNM